jgi:hypothetical protein
MGEIRKQSFEPLKTRREFIQGMACVTGAITAGISGPAFSSGTWASRKVTLFVLSDASDSTLRHPPIRWALEQLQNALQSRGLIADIQYNLERIHEPCERILVTPSESRLAHRIAGHAGVTLPSTAESLALIHGSVRAESVLMTTGADVRGMVYGILEIADRVTYSRDPIVMLRSIDQSVEQPANSIRSMTRLFVSDIEDKSWFYDKAFWQAYLSMLISQRFNRFSLTLGLGYDSPKNVLDSYFIFAYPYLVSVADYQVTVRNLPSGERERNLAMLQFISSEAARRGLHFQLGLWGHAYACQNSPNVNYVIEGLDAKTHAPYCRDAVRTLLQACPDIHGITFRAHYESGIPDGSKGFWETVFQGVAHCGRRVEIDLHAKGISFDQIRMALDTGQPVHISPKLTAEHMGLPAHQAAMREMERVPNPNSRNPRNSTARYGYSDYLFEDREYGVYSRIWPGKQKILLWADPALAAGYGRHAGFCGSLGLEVCEPLCFKGRQGSGTSPERRIYEDRSLIPMEGNWRKYLYAYRIWGRHLYNPDADPETYRRYLRAEFGAAASAVENSLAHTSRILPLITSAHLPAGSAMTYWPEMYTNMPIADRTLSHPYGDTPRPKVFGRVSPLDPAMFSPFNEFVDTLIEGKVSGRYSPADVANWLEGFVKVSKEQLSLAKARVPDTQDPSFRRVFIDVKIHNGLGMFFAQKFRAAIAYGLYEEKNDLESLRDAVYFYRAARQAWVDIIKYTKGIYVDKLGFGHRPHIRGHWADRLPAIDQDLTYMEKQLQEKENGSVARLAGPSQAAAVWLQPRPARPPCEHPLPTRFHPGQPLDIKLNSKSPELQTVKLYYRHVNQVEAYQIQTLTRENGTWRGTIGGDFTDSRYPLMYYFELFNARGNAWLYPGFEPDLANQPYYHVQQRNR